MCDVSVHAARTVFPALFAAPAVHNSSSVVGASAAAAHRGSSSPPRLRHTAPVLESALSPRSQQSAELQAVLNLRLPGGSPQRRQQSKHRQRKKRVRQRQRQQKHRAQQQQLRLKMQRKLQLAHSTDRATPSLGGRGGKALHSGSHTPGARRRKPSHQQRARSRATAPQLDAKTRALVSGTWQRNGHGTAQVAARPGFGLWQDPESEFKLPC